MMQDESAIDGVNEDLYNQDDEYGTEEDTNMKGYNRGRRNREYLNDTYADFD